MQGHIATWNLQKPLNQLRNIQKESEIEVPWKITHAFKKEDEGRWWSLSSFCHDFCGNRHRLTWSWLCQNLCHDDFTVWTSLEVPSEPHLHCPEGTVSNGGTLLDTDFWEECVAYTLISWFCMKILDESIGNTFLYTSLLQLPTWSRMLCTKEPGNKLIYFLTAFEYSVPTVLHYFIHGLYIYVYIH